MTSPLILLAFWYVAVAMYVANGLRVWPVSRLRWFSWVCAWPVVIVASAAIRATEHLRTRFPE